MPARRPHHLAALALAGVALAAAPGFRLISRQSRTFASETKFPRSSPELVVDRHDNRIQAGAVASLHLLALAGPKADMMSFQIETLKNPEIRLARGTRLTLSVVNVDDDMAHDLYLTDRPPPYPRRFEAGALGTGVLAPYAHGRYQGAELILQPTTPGTYYYVCTVPGHATAGMWGRIVVAP